MIQYFTDLSVTLYYPYAPPNAIEDSTSVARTQTQPSQKRPLFLSQNVEQRFPFPSPFPPLRNRPTLLILRHPQIIINRRTERRKAGAPHSRSLGSRLRRQRAARDTPRRNAIVQIVFRPEALNAALGAREDSADHAEVFGRRVGRAAHFAQPLSQLLPDGEGGDFGALGREGGVIAHLVGSLQLEEDLVWRQRGGRAGLTLLMNSPNMPPKPAPMTPDMMVLPTQLSMPICICW